MLEKTVCIKRFDLIKLHVFGLLISLAVIEMNCVHISVLGALFDAI